MEHRVNTGLVMPESVSGSGSAYRAFVSYSHADRGWCDWLHKALETYRVPSRLVGAQTAHGIIPRKLAPIFRDRDELPSAHDLNNKVAQALADSENLVVICSPHSAHSHWVNEEVLAYKRLDRADRIFCLIVDGEPNASDLPGRETEECFCPALRFQLDGNGRPNGERTEPIAADARAGKDGKANAKLKLIAGMLDVGFDALKQRELQRRNRRMTAIAALALVVMLVTSTLAVYALISRHEAVIAQQQAVVARQAAERRQKQAESLVGFMLGDLNDKLAQVSRLDIMRSVDDKAMAYFDSLPAADATDSALALRVTALEKIGGVRSDQGDTPAALLAFQAASALAAELVRRAPNDAARQATYGDSLKWIGQAHLYQGNMAHALQDFQAASAALRRAAAAKPDDGDLAFQLATAYHDSGYVLDHRGDFAAAQGLYEAALHIFTHWHAREPGKARWQSYEGDEYDSLGKLALEQGRLEQAIASYRADQQIKSTLFANTPNDHKAQENLVMSDAILGRTLALIGDMQSAVRYTRAAVDNAKTLTRFDSTNTSWQDYYGLYGQQLGGLLRQDGQLDDATTADAEAVRVLTALTAKDPGSTYWPPDLAQAQLESARLQWTRNDIGTAQTSANAALAIVQRLREKSPDDRSLILLEAQADALLGRLAAQRNDAAAAQQDWMQARNLLQPALHAGNDPNFLAAYAEVLLGLDADKDAQPIIARLNGMGYSTPDFLALIAGKHIVYGGTAASRQQAAQTTK